MELVGREKLDTGAGADSQESDFRSRTYGMLPDTERYRGLPFPRGGVRTGRLEYGGHQNGHPSSTQRLPMLMTSGVVGKTYGSITDRSAGLLISNFIFAAILPPHTRKGWRLVDQRETLTIELVYPTLA